MLVVNPVEWRKPTTAKSGAAIFGETYVSWGGNILPSQLHFLNEAYAQDDSGKWIHQRVAMNAPRQNAKTKQLTCIIAYAAYVLGMNIYVTAHETAAASKIYEDVLDTILSNGELAAELKSKRYNAGRQEIRLTNGAIITFRSRKTATSGMGGTYDMVIFDEAQELLSSFEGMITKTLKTRPNPITIYTGTPYLPNSGGDVFNETIANAKDDDGIFAVRYGIDDDTADVEDEKLWELTNPLYPDVIPKTAFQTDIRIARQTGDMGLIDFRIQDLGLWWENKVPPVIPAELWTKAFLDIEHDKSTLVYSLVFDPLTSVLALSVAARSNTGEFITGEIIEERSSVNSWTWITSYLRGAPRATPLILDAGGLNSALAEDIIPKGIDVCYLTGSEFLASQQGFMDLLNKGDFKHTNNATLNEEVHNAMRVTAGKESWKFASIQKGETVAGLKALAQAVWWRAAHQVKEVEQRTVYV